MSSTSTSTSTPSPRPRPPVSATPASPICVHSSLSGSLDGRPASTPLRSREDLHQADAGATPSLPVCSNPGLFAGLYSIAFSLGQRFTTGLPYAPPPVPQHGDNQELGRKIWLRQAL
ncbi:hypothetical protein GQ607_013720 [Colletotrichum asianum]|uniref:Uncharacterized protein n=1 Tax=Colletotrichum asianum TaxID=702518 RepID=A0A8H3W1X3_9PEZI|nr:hypothetical protein GQ607_013720 [Colletotrichum asianum]